MRLEDMSEIHVTVHTNLDIFESTYFLTLMCVVQGPRSIFWIDGAISRIVGAQRAPRGRAYLEQGGSGILPQTILAFTASEITRNAFIFINPEKIFPNFYHHSVGLHLKHNCNVI